MERVRREIFRLPGGLRIHDSPHGCVLCGPERASIDLRITQMSDFVASPPLAVGGSVLHVCVSTDVFEL